MTLTIDRAGRVVIPKPVRDKLGLRAGSTLEMLETPEGVTLKPADRKSPLAMERGFLVITSELPPGYDMTNAVEEEREARYRKIWGL